MVSQDRQCAAQDLNVDGISPGRTQTHRLWSRNAGAEGTIEVVDGIIQPVRIDEHRPAPIRGAFRNRLKRAPSAPSGAVSGGRSIGPQPLSSGPLMGGNSDGRPVANEPALR